MSALAECYRNAEEIIRPPPDRSAWQWADENRQLPGGSAEAGQWETARTPYMFAPYEAASNPECKTLIMVMGAQMGKTEFELNVIGHRFDDGPYCPAMYVGPTQKQVSSMSRDRFRKMFESTPSLSKKLAGGQKDMITEKFIGGVRLGFAWSGSATELSSHPCGLAVMDERDRMDDDVSGEGDPTELVRARLTTFSNKLLVSVSTPTTFGASPIVHLFNNGTMFKWYWPCKNCNAFFLPSLSLLSYPDSDDVLELYEGTRIACPECGTAHEDKDRELLNAAGQYMPHAIDQNQEYIRIDEPINSPTFSYWVSGLASTWAKWGERAEQYRNACKTNNQKTIQACVNTAFGETFTVHGDAPEIDEMRDLINDMERGQVPDSAQMITVGCDVQGNGIYYVVRAWSFNGVSHLVDNGFIFGNTEYDDVWLVWSRFLNKTYGNDMMVDRCFIDSGYNPRKEKFRRPAHKIYEVCRRTHGRAFPTKGLPTADKRLSTSKQDIDRQGKAKGTVLLWRINTDYYKSELRAHNNLPDGEQSKFTIHRDVEDDYLRQMVSEELIIKENGDREWSPHGRDNHYFDCEVLALAAADSRSSHTLPAVNPATIVPNQNAAARKATDPRMRHRGHGFQRR